MNSTCPTCGGLTVIHNFNEAAIIEGKCGYFWASHFGGGEPQTKPCRSDSQPPHDTVK